MKEIVVGIDFSNSSINAFHYAVRLAEVCECNIKLVYVSKRRDKKQEYIKDDKGMLVNISKGFRHLIAENQDKLKGEISHKILCGKIYEEISNQAKYTDAEMIITGAHGMSGFEELWVGNNAMKIISHSVKPVLSIRKNYTPRKLLIEKIVLPIDSTPETLQKVPFTIKMARLFNAQINVLSLFSSKLKNIEEKVENNTAEAMEAVISSDLRHINEKRVCDNIAKETINYAEKRNADLLSIMTEQEFSSHNVLLGTYAQQTVNLSPIPLLSFRTRKSSCQQMEEQSNLMLFD